MKYLIQACKFCLKLSFIEYILWNGGQGYNVLYEKNVEILDFLKINTELSFHVFPIWSFHMDSEFNTEFANSMVSLLVSHEIMDI